MSNGEKTGGKTGHFKKGHDPRRGHGKKGRSGRKPSAFNELCAAQLDDHELIAEVGKMARDKKARPSDRMKAIEFLAAYAHGKPSQELRHQFEEVPAFEVQVVPADE